MLRELLMSLQGYPGSLFVLHNNKLEVSPCIPWLSPSEISLLNNILEVGSGYCFLMKYCNKTAPEGLYITTVRKSIKNALQGYLNCLASLETKALENSGLNLSHILANVSSFAFLISGLSDLVKEIETYEAHGCYILDIIHRHTLSGIPAVQQAMDKLMIECEEIFTKQMIGWLVFGRLRDPFKEFFVIHASSNQSKDASSFHLEGKMIPTCYITPAIAAQALNVGEMINLYLQSNSESDEAEELDVLKQIQNARNNWECSLEVARIRVAKRMWRLVVTDGKAKAYMTTIHNFFLMGRGELFIELLDNAARYLDVVPGATTQTQFQRLLVQSATRVLRDEDEELENITVKIDPVPDPNNEGQVGWQRLALRYKTSWPVSLLLTDEILEQYSEIFVRLLYLKHVQKQLLKLWQLPRQEAREQSVAERSDLTCLIYELRWTMLHFLLHFCHYAQADVIETLWLPLQKLLRQKQGDFEELRNAQAYFLVTAKAQIFLQSSPVRSCLDDLLSLCLQFCQIVCNYSPDSLSDLVESLKIVKEEFHRLFALFVTLLTSLLKRSQISELDSGLAQLLFRFTITGYKVSVNKTVR